MISSKEYYEAGRDHLTDDGIMMQWIPYGGSEGEFRDHLRTFASVFPHVMVIRGPGGFGQFMLGALSPIELTEANIRSVLARPGVLADVSSAFDSRATTADAWVSRIADLIWLSGSDAQEFAGEGPLITDDHPRPEYFLLRRLVSGSSR